MQTYSSRDTTSRLALKAAALGALIALGGIGTRAGAQAAACPLEKDCREEPGKRWALVVGISEYKELERAKWLNFADADARAFAAFLQSPAGGSVPASRIQLLTNGEATASRIYHALRFLETAGERDTVMIFLAGHAAAETVDDQKNARPFFLATDVDPEVYESGGILFESLQTRIGRLKAARVILILDACHAGAMGAAKRGEVVQAGAALQTEWGNTMSLLSSGKGQLSKEDVRWGGGHGVFTFFLLQALHGDAAQAGSGAITFRQIRDFIETKVDSATGGQQSPKAFWAGRANDTVHVVPVTLAGVARSQALNAVLTAGKSGPILVADAGRSATRDLEYVRRGAALDPAVQKAMEAFVDAINDGRYTEPDSANAWALYQALVRLPKSERVAPIARNLIITAFADPADAIIRRYVAGGNEQPPGDVFRNGARLIARSLEVMSADDPNRADYVARQLFLDGYAILRNQERERYAEAKRLLERSIELQPRAPYVYNALGLVYWRLDQFDSAATLFRAASARATDWQYPVTNLAGILREKGDARGAIRTYLAAIAKDTLNPDAYNNLGNVYSDLGRFVQAERYYRKAVQLEPTESTARGNIALLYRLKGRFATAQAYLDTALALQRRDSLGVFSLWTTLEQGRLLSAQRDRPAALAVFLKAVDKAPNYAEPYFYVGEMYRLMDSTALAERYYRRAIEVDSLCPDGYTGLAYLYMYGRPRRYADAERALATARARIPHSAAVVSTLGHLYGRWSADSSVARAQRAQLSIRAESAYVAAIRMDSLSTDNYEDLADLLEERNDHAAAERWLVRGMRMNDSSVTAPYAVAEFYRRRAVTDSVRAADWTKRQETTLRTIVRIDPEFASVHSALGALYLQRDQFDSAAKEFQVAAGLGFAANTLRQFAVALQTRASVLSRAGRHADAAGAYRLARQLDPANRSVLEGLATTAYLAGNAASARLYADSAIAEAQDDEQRSVLRVLRVKILLDLDSASRAVGDIDDVVPDGPNAFVDPHWQLVKAMAHNVVAWSTRQPEVKNPAHARAEAAYRAAVAQAPANFLDEASLRSSYSPKGLRVIAQLRREFGPAR